MTDLFEEMKRRKVYRVAGAYAVVAGGIIQLASAAFPAWDLPNWALRLVIVLLLIGFPIALIFAWIFDITPTGIERTSQVQPQTMPRSHRRRNMFIIAGVGALVALAAGAFLLPHAAARKLDKSIAVLPFENFSDDKESGYFADGIQDDILTNLAKIGDLKVISRSSVKAYRGKTDNVRDIGNALGVSALLEGSVRKSGNRVRVNVQLIDARNDKHLWAEDYDRDLTDVFSIQTDLARKIANELQAKLSPTEKAQMTQRPTKSDEAYLAFIEARGLFVPEDFAKLQQAEQLYERALHLDENFAVAIANYSRVESWIYRNFDKTPPRIQKARELAQRAAHLQPNLPDAHLALGYCIYYGDLDYPAAAREFEFALRGLPNEPEARLAMGAIQRRLGRWQESNVNLEKAAELSPNESWPLQNLAMNYEMLRDWDAAQRTLDRALKMSPNSLTLHELKAKYIIEQTGDVPAAQQQLSAIPPESVTTKQQRFELDGVRANIALLARNYADAIRIAEAIPDQELGGVANDSYHSKYTTIGAAKLVSHDELGARDAFQKAKAVCESQLANAPNDAAIHSLLGLVLAALGEREAAVAAAQRATELLPESKDAFDGPTMTLGLAQTHAILGDVEASASLLDALLQRPSPITLNDLKLNPIWDRVRDSAPFEALLQKYSAKS